MKHRTKKRAALVIAALAAALATAAAAQNTQTTHSGNMYPEDSANHARGSGNERLPQGSGPDGRRQSSYPQPGTAADATGMATGRGAERNTGAQPATNGAQPGK